MVKACQRHDWRQAAAIRQQICFGIKPRLTSGIRFDSPTDLGRPGCQLTNFALGPAEAELRNAESALETERSWDSVELWHHHAGYRGEGGRFAGLGDAHVGTNAQ